MQIFTFHPEKSSYHKEHLPDYGDRYLFSTEYAQPTKELYSKLEKYIDKEYVDYEAFKRKKTGGFILKKFARGWIMMTLLVPEIHFIIIITE